ncbi:MAG: tol-pal system-associated acyl-CoA thioesterase, partial [Burkholderiaceae bacterium]|nr:tol-pal system-associated acyl-CoA thioesterase [Burkholderiaceae bacterium]
MSAAQPPEGARTAAREGEGRAANGAVLHDTPQGREFRWPLRVYWEDTDAGGIVFYANYLKFLERARTEWLRAMGISQSTLREETGGMFVVSETSVRYLRPARLDDELIVTARLEEAGKASLIIAQRALLANPVATNGTLPVLCEGRIRIGWVDAHRMAPARIPARI